MAQAKTEKKTSLEPSEVFCAMGLLMTVSEINKLVKDIAQSGKVKIILTTARKSSSKDKTINQLKKLGIPYDTIIFDLYHQILIIYQLYIHSMYFQLMRGMYNCSPKILYLCI